MANQNADDDARGVVPDAAGQEPQPPEAGSSSEETNRERRAQAMLLGSDHFKSSALGRASEYSKAFAEKGGIALKATANQRLAADLLNIRSPLAAGGEAARLLGLGSGSKAPPNMFADLARSPSSMIDRDKFGHLHALISADAENPLLKSLRAGQRLTIDTGLASSIQRAQETLEESYRPLATLSLGHGAQRDQRLARAAVMTSLGGLTGNVARASQWASTFGAIRASDVARYLGPDLGTAVGDMRAAMSATISPSVAADYEKIRSMLGLSSKLTASFEATQLKMSAFAGLGQILDPGNALRLDAYKALFGSWRTHPDLPEDFWRDRKVRARMYREAGVDDGLVAATADVALDVVIDSGLAAGMRTATSTAAVITFGEVSMTIRSAGTRKDLYSVIERFELELRSFVARKLEARFGPEWFKQRASNLVGKAKAIRKAAMERGEDFAPLIDFVELGELGGIIQSAPNWDEVFGDVFVNRAEFGHDMQKLVAARRPTMHIRPIDGVRLVEMICVAQRLFDQMADDGAWKRKADLDW